MVAQFRGCGTYDFFFQAEDGIRDYKVTGVQTCALPISHRLRLRGDRRSAPSPRDLRHHLRAGRRRLSGAPRADPPRAGVEIGRASCRARVEDLAGARRCSTTGEYEDGGAMSRKTDAKRE